jgi:hypothetical protein
MDDCASLVETMLQWMSASTTARTIDRELGDLRRDHLAERPLLTYLRYNIELSPGSVHQLKPELAKDTIESLSEMDAPDNMDILHELGKLDADRSIRAESFPAAFDLV